MANTHQLGRVIGFLGLIGYYRYFVAGYGSLSWPLTQQLKDSFDWIEDAEVAFQKLKAAMTSVRCWPHQTFHSLLF